MNISEKVVRQLVQHACLVAATNERRRYSSFMGKGFFGRLKTEKYFLRDRVSTTMDEFVAALNVYIRGCSEVWIKSSPDFHSPAEHRRSAGIAAYPVEVFYRTASW